MDSRLLIGCSGWNYPDPPDRGGWLNVFYPDTKTRKLNYYSQFFQTVEMDATFYKRFYLNMTKGLFIGLTKATPPDFKFSVKVPEIITHEKRLDLSKNVIEDLDVFLEKISPLKFENKLGAIIIQLPPSFTLNETKKLEQFLSAIQEMPSIEKNTNLAVEFRHHSWNTEGVLEMLKHYKLSTVLTDSPSTEKLDFLSNENNITSKNLTVIRLHGRNTSKDHYWYNYLYSKDELAYWIKKLRNIQQKSESVFVYFNNHYAGKAILNAFQFKEMFGDKPLSQIEIQALDRAKSHLIDDD